MGKLTKTSSRAGPAEPRRARNVIFTVGLEKECAGNVEAAKENKVRGTPGIFHGSCVLRGFPWRFLQKPYIWPGRWKNYRSLSRRGWQTYGNRLGPARESWKTLLEPTPAQPKAEAGAAQKRCLPGWWLHGEAGKPCWNQRLCSSGPRAGRLRQKGRPLHGKAGNPAGTSASAAQRRGRGGVKVSDLNRGPTYGNRLGPARESWKTLLEPAPRQHRAEGGAVLR